MAFRILILLTFALLSAACGRDPEAPPGSTCWRHVIDLPGKSANRLTVCAKGASATHHVYFPNSWLRMIPPTHCTSTGSVRAGPGDAMMFSFAKGQCANGMPMKPTTLACDRAAEGLACRYDGHDFLFRPVEGE